MEQFRKIQVVMLPTKERSELFIGDDDNGTQLLQGIALKYNSANNQHLYFLSDDKIEEGDWIYHTSKRIIFQVNTGKAYSGTLNITLGYAQKYDACKKIIATTDTSLKRTVLEHTEHCIDKYEKEAIQKQLPQPSQQFIEKYVESYNIGTPITEVLVEYEQTHWKGTKLSYEDKFKLKVNQDNTINIKPVKDSWNREEVEELINKLNNYVTLRYDIDSDYINDWIKQNL